MMNNTEGVLIYKELPSTNQQMAKLLQEIRLNEGTTIRAIHQTAGRGQINNTWESEAGSNLTFSTYLSPMIAPQEQFIMNMGVSLALYQCISPYLDEVYIKWPNDLFCQNRKIAGILIESVIRGMKINQTIVGIGLNVNQKSFSNSLPLAASMRMISGRDYDQDVILEQFLHQLSHYYQAIKEGGHQGIMDEYQEHLYRKDQFLDYQDGQGKFTGSIRGVDQMGRIQIETSSGELRSYAFKQVQYLY